MKLKYLLSWYFFLLALASTIATGCKKQDEFLEAKPSASLAVPSSLADLQSLLQYESLFNSNDPALGQIASDDGYVSTSVWNSLTTLERNGYIWAKQVYDAGADVPDWTSPYRQVYYANTVLDALPVISYNNAQQSLYNQIKGTALFYRSIAFYNLLQNFTVPYQASSAGTDPGIPLRLTSDLNKQSIRSSQQQCYAQITGDLKAALPLLPVTPSYKTEPSIPAVNGLLARLYLVMGNYDAALAASNACLLQYATLVDYNTLKPAARTISTTYLAEDIFHSRMVGYAINAPNSKAITDPILYRSYGTNDLRKTVFFVLTSGLPYFRGTYDFKRYLYSGIATDEIYLIRAECYARAGRVAEAMKDLNTLLVMRWKTGTFVPFSASSAEDALGQILKERRKELLFRGLRWTDLRRLNPDPRFAVTLARNIGGQIYSLPPEDPRYAWPIPDDEIQASGIPQNPR